MTENKNYDAVIIGGSYAGLSAALSMARALKNVLIIDGQNPCNRQTPHSHNFITQDGVAPGEITKLALAQVLAYPTAQLVIDHALAVMGVNDNFRIATATGAVYNAKKLLFATGIKDMMPAIPGFSECWGISIIHCPYCHGYEYHGKNTGILMTGDAAAEHAEFINNWTDKLTIFTDGDASISIGKQESLAAKGIDIVEKKIHRFQHNAGQLSAIEFMDGEQLPLEAMYAKPAFTQHCTIPEIMGCSLTAAGYLKVNEFNKTTVSGVYAAGDNVSPMRSVSGAVAAGTLAGAMMSRELILGDF